MILKRLDELARNRGLVHGPNYVTNRVDFWLTVDDAGHGTLTDAGQVARWTPNCRHTVAVEALPTTFDKSMYVLGFFDPKKDDPDRAARCAEAFRACMLKIAQETKDPAALAIHTFLSNLQRELPAIFAVKAQKDWTGGENIGFVYAPDGSKPVHDRPAIMQWIASSRSQAEVVPCLDDGSLAAPARLHNVIKRVPGTQSAGVSLSSFNNIAFESHGWEQGRNAPVTSDTMAGYTAGLNWLLAKEDGHLELPDGWRFRQGLSLGDALVALWWTPEAHPFERSLLNLLNRPTTADIEALGAETNDPTPIYALVLSGDKGRIAVRAFIESTVGQVRQSLLDWFTVLGTQSFYNVMKTMMKRDGDLAPRPYRTALFRACFEGSAFPITLATFLLRLLQQPQEDRNLTFKRQRLHQLALTRHNRTMPMSLDLQNTQTPYLLGRQFAYYEDIQYRAMGEVNTTVGDRYYKIAATTPNRVSAKLRVLCDQHIKKIKARNPGLAAYYTKEIETMKGLLQTSPAPARLNFQEQALFELGYYHQRAAFRAQRTVKKTDEGSSESTAELN